MEGSWDKALTQWVKSAISNGGVSRQKMHPSMAAQGGTEECQAGHKELKSWDSKARTPRFVILGKSPDLSVPSFFIWKMRIVIFYFMEPEPSSIVKNTIILCSIKKCYQLNYDTPLKVRHIPISQMLRCERKIWFRGDG